MAEKRTAACWIRLLAMVCIIALFTVDVVLGWTAKEPPWWSYPIIGLLALGVEVKAVADILIEIVRATARVPNDRRDDL